MTYFWVGGMVREQREVLLEWVRAEGLAPEEIRDNGSFSVHNGRVSGEKFLLDAEGNVQVRHDAPVTVHFHQAQKNPLPEVLV